MRPFIVLSCILAVLCMGYVEAEEMIFFADDHYKALGEPLLQASAVNPTVEPGRSTTLRITLANAGRLDELVPIDGNGSEEDIVQEMEEELHNIDALNITAALTGDGDIAVTSSPDHIDSLPAGSVAEMKFNLSASENAADGWHDLPLNITYEHQADVIVADGVASPLYQLDNYSQALRVAVLESDGPLKILDTKSYLSPGSRGTILTAIKNSEVKPLRNCTLRLLAAAPFHTLGEACSIPDLLPGEVTTASFPVQVDGNASPKEYYLACEAIYEGNRLVLPFTLVLEANRESGYMPLIILVIIAASAGLALVWLRKGSKFLRRRRMRR